MHGGKEECIYDFGGKTRRKETDMEADVGGKIVLK
jgi:hypothetical protein